MIGVAFGERPVGGRHFLFAFDRAVHGLVRVRDHLCLGGVEGRGLVGNRIGMDVDSLRVRPARVHDATKHGACDGGPIRIMRHRNHYVVILLVGRGCSGRIALPA